ncbi:hypothetical protein VTN49DRAFT_5538 [Thermomyces lanuginosus]|uniref:uncharacterized protein n=1 Tax=Thermomyces lanuginosus TaxID=5541 RepID=UPI0037435F40
MEPELQPSLQSPPDSRRTSFDGGDTETACNSIEFAVPHPTHRGSDDRPRVKFSSWEETLPGTEEEPLSQDAINSVTADLEKGETARSGLGQDGGPLTRGASLRDRAREWMTRLGRPEEPGDGLTPPQVEEMDEVSLIDAIPGQREQDKREAEARRIVRAISQHSRFRRRKPQRTFSSDSVPSTPGDSDTENEQPSKGEGVLSQLLKLQQRRDDGTRSGHATPDGAVTPPKRAKWYQRHSPSSSTMSLIGAGLNIGTPGTPTALAEMKQNLKRDPEKRITVRIAAILTKQRYMMLLCRALMRFGAPSHRLEEYMQMTARALDVRAQFLYLPGFMIMSFDDVSTHTAEVKLLRVQQGVDLARLDATQDIYKSIIHDKITVDEAIEELEAVMNRPPKYPLWVVILCYGLASVSVGPFAFEARPIDMPIIFMLGCILGVMKLVWLPRSSLYSNVFEVLASVVISFLARAFGSIRNGVVDGKQQYLFCFSSITQSSIALILPGFLVLCSSLELQSQQMIAGSIRMVYAIIYSLFLGYGITVGTTIYGLMDANANSNTTCSSELIGNNPYLQRFPFVAAFVIFLTIINQGKWKQMPVMTFIAVAGYVVNHFSTERLQSNLEVANTLGAFTVGTLGNLYSRLWHGHAATAILPAIFVLVPSGLAASGSLVAGVQSAAEIRGNLTGSGPQQALDAATKDTKTSMYEIGFGMIEVAIGITVGLFLSAVVIYPFGKRRSGLFSF